MKLLYTAISNDMTTYLAQEAQQFAEAGKRVFYIAPNSLSFEKERKVLESLPNQASFRITITRFAQMARYFVLNSDVPQQTMDDTGLSMIFFRALSQLSDMDLKLYGRLRKDPAFIKQLMDLYREMKTANLTLFDLESLSDEKEADLVTIFSAVTALLQDLQVENRSQLSVFAQQVEAGFLDKELSETVLVIDGFTRFSAEEEALIAMLSDKCHEIIIGTYASQKAYQANFIAGNVYQAPVEFLRQLAIKYAVKPHYLNGDKETETDLDVLMQHWESLHDFTRSEDAPTVHPENQIQIWSALNQKEEIELVARRIRHLLADGVRYKDILVLLGDVDSYKLQVEQVFENFAIPYYFGKAESMANHPLVHFVDSLERLHRYRFRAEDVLNLMKSGLFGSFSQAEVDRFAHYVRFADIKGTRFSKDFRANNGGAYDLGQLNQIRLSLMESLDYLFVKKEQTGLDWLTDFHVFLNRVSLAENMEQLTENTSPEELEKHEQVWTVFSSILQQIELIFGMVSLSLEDFLALLRTAMLAAEYRTVPATVDVVNIKSYDLVEPHSSPYVFALGMTKGHFPKVVQNKSLLSDEERLAINALSGEFASFEIASQEISKKNRFTALSLFHAAEQELVLSYPQVVNEAEDDVSVYLKELNELGVSIQDKSNSRFEAKSESIGNYRDVLGTVLALNQDDLGRELNKEEETFWAVASRYLSKRLAAKDVLIPGVVDDIATVPVGQDVLSIRFPEEEPISLSVSALTTFYTNQYLYFLRYVLGLKELETIHPDHRHHGQYLHKVFELTMKEEGDFDKRLERAIANVNQSEPFVLFYDQDDEARYSKEVLETIARSTASLLKRQETVSIQSQEELFQFLVQDSIQIRGIIDRVDRLSQSGGYGVVDYKSGANQFDIQQFYNGLNSQLVTYLEALKKKYKIDVDQLFGAMYLHMQEPKVDLKSVTSLEELPQKAQTELTYKGLFNEQQKGFLGDGSYHLNNSLYQTDELQTLLDHNAFLFQEAEKTIRKGHFLINPYTKDGRSVAGQQEKSITHFEADRHMGQARRLITGPSRGKKETFIQLMKQENPEKGGQDSE
ncbi:ATP-dependent nuclease subunit B [Streptococcus cameli]